MITLSAESFSEMKSVCKEFLDLCQKTENKGELGMRNKKRFTEYELNLLTDWLRQDKKPAWIARQLDRDPKAIYQKIYLIKRTKKLYARAN